MKRVLLLLLLLGGTAHAQNAQRTWNYLTTGNGFGFQVFDTNKNKIVSFLEHPYRYLRPDVNPMSDGIGRRNLAFDVYFGVRGGGASGWLNAPSSAGDPSYVDQDNIIVAPAQMGTLNVESYFVAPFGYDGNALVALLHAPGGTDGFALFNFHMGGGVPDSPDANGESIRAGAGGSVVETGPGGGAMIYVPLSGVDHADCVNAYAKVTMGNDLGDNVTCSGNDVVPAFQRKLGADGWMAVAMIFVEDPATADAAIQSMQSWAAAKSPTALLDAVKAEFDGWRKPPPAGVPLCTDDEKKLWRQSETVLRMGQVREPTTATRKNTGMILASLPPGEWHTGWVRDATFAVVALSRAGHYAEAKAALNFFLNAAPVGGFSSYVSGQSYRISVVRYYGNGAEQADYSGQPTPNVEIDGWGLVMWAARQYVDASGDTAWLSSPTALGPTVYDALAQGVAAPLEANLETNGLVKADSSIWEVHDANKKHFAFTTMAGARGFCDMAELATKAGKAPDAMHYAQVSSKIRTAFLSAFVDSHGALAGSLEGLSQNKYFDGALAETFTWNLLPDFTGMTATATLDVFSHLKVDSGGFKRNDDGLSSYDNNEWILVDFRIANAFRRAGQGMAADGYLAQIVQKASVNFYLLPELYNAVQADGQIGKYTGSIPMVGYGGGAYLMTMIDRGGVIEPNDCGDGKGVTLPSFTCAGGTGPIPDGGTDPGGGNGDGGAGTGPGGSNAPYLPACYCALGAGGSSSRGHGGTLLLLFLPGLAIAWRLRRRAR